MSKYLFIAEKPMVARAFAEAMGENLTRHDGYQESEHVVVTWCVGHLVTMSYPEVYDEKYKRWSLDTLPFIPDKFLYEVIPSVKKQFEIVKGLLNREDVSRIYVCTDSGREGEYIYRLVRQEAHVTGKEEKRVWIDSQTEEEIKRGIREAKDISAYDSLASAAYLRAKEDYLMGINFSRALTLKFGYGMASFLNRKSCVISVGRVMTCVLGMVVRREIEIRNFVKTPFYRVLGNVNSDLSMEWKSVEGSEYFNSPLLYKENGFKEKKDADELIKKLEKVSDQFTVNSVTRKKEKKNPPLLYNLAEIQNDASRFFKISPDQTLNVIQSLYEKGLVTYPRTDARVLSSAIAKVIDKNISGLRNIPGVKAYAEEILSTGSYNNIAKTRYTDDSKITDHYAIIPTGQGIGQLKSLDKVSVNVYETIVRRFLAIFYPPAVYQKVSIDASAEVTGNDSAVHTEHLFANDRYLDEEGYLKVMNYSFFKKKNAGSKGADKTSDQENQQDADSDGDGASESESAREFISHLRKGSRISFTSFEVKEGETSPPKRYTSGSMILAMENAGSLIEDEELREQIKSNGIGTSATRAGILEKLVKNRYLSLNKRLRSSHLL